jgi:GAF domain-containing protein
VAGSSVSPRFAPGLTSIDECLNGWRGRSRVHPVRLWFSSWEGQALCVDRRGEVVNGRDAAALDAVVSIARALGEEAGLAEVLDLVARRGRALVCARAVAVEVQEEGRMAVAALAGELPVGLDAARENPESAVLVVPLVLRGCAYGALVAVDRQSDGPRFSVEDEELLEALAPLATSALAAGTLGDRRRPVALDHVGLAGAIELLADLVESPKLEIRTRLDLSFEGGRAADRPGSEMEGAVYRFVQEALASVVKCPGTSQVLVEVVEDDERGELRIEVRSTDDGGPRIAATVPAGWRWRSMLNSY